MGKKKNKYKRRRANNLNLHTRVRIVRIITWNSGADKKKKPSVQMVCDGRGPGSGPFVFFLTSARITRALSKRSATVRNVFSQQGVVGLLSPSQLPLNVSLANRAAGRRRTAPPTTDTLSTFLLYSFLLFSFFFTHFSTAPLSGRTDDKGNSPKTIHTKLVWQIQSIRKTHINIKS